MNRVIVDTSFFMDMRAMETAKADIIDVWVASDGVATELAQHIRSGETLRQKRALKAEEVIKYLQEKNHLKFVKDIGNHGVDDSLVYVAMHEKLPLLSLDNEMREHALRDGVELFLFDEINHLNLPLHVGKRMKVKIDHKGRRKHQGVVEHEMGTIYVSGAAEVGTEIEIVISKVDFQGVSVILFADLV